MEKAHLVVTEHIDWSAVNDLKKRLSQDYELGDCQYISRNALELPQFIDLVALKPFWTALSVAGVLFLKKLIELSAEDIYDTAKKKFKQDDGNAVEKLASDLLASKEDSEIPFQYILRIILAEGDFNGAVVLLKDDDLLVFTKMIAKFSLISTELHELLEDKRPVLGNALVNFPSDEEAVIEWMDMDMNRHSKSISLSLNKKA